MQISAEIRWFWRNSPPPNLEEWFCASSEHTCSAGGGGERVDEYMADCGQTELGLKRRGGKGGIEVKGLVAADWDALNVSPFLGPIELWSKWTCEGLELNSTTPIKKVRWLRKFSTESLSPEEIPLGESEMPLDKNRALPRTGCNVELTRIITGQEVWWTLGFESFGQIQTVSNDLRAVAATLEARKPPELGPAGELSSPIWRGQNGAGLIASYPVWLREVLWPVRIRV